MSTASNPSPSPSDRPAPTPPPGTYTKRKLLVTPALATSVLERQDPNRPVRQAHVDALAAAMAGGRFKDLGDPIRFDRLGRLIDGQHRLWACVQAGVPFWAEVVEGLDPEDYHLIDSGKPRSSADDLAFAGRGYAHRLAASLHLLASYERGAVASGKRLSRPELVAFERLHPEMARSVQVATRTHRLIPGSMGGLLHYLFGRLDPEAADRFFAQLHDGAGLEAGHPILVLRNRLTTVQSGKARLTLTYRGACAVLAWNALRSGRTTVGKSALSWSAERPFPTPL